MSAVLFEMGGISITKSAAKFNDASYRITDISGIRIVTTPSTTDFARDATRFGHAVIFIGAFSLLVWIPLGVACVVGGVFMSAFGHLTPKSELKGQHTLVLSTKSGFVQAYTTSDPKLAATIQSAIERAFVARALLNISLPAWVGPFEIGRRATAAFVMLLGALGRIIYLMVTARPEGTSFRPNSEATIARLEAGILPSRIACGLFSERQPAVPSPVH